MQEKVFWTNPGYEPGPSLGGDTTAQFAIVGGGIAGLSAAYFLLEHGIEGNDIVIVEAETVGSGSTGRSGGMIIPEPENHQSAWWGALIEQYGLPLIKSYRERHLHAFSIFKKLAQEISCDAQAGDLLLLAADDEARAFIERDLKGRRMLGETPHGLAAEVLQKELKSPWFVYADRTAEGLSVNPLAFIQGFAGYLRGRGVRIYERTRVESVTGTALATNQGTVNFKKCILAQGVGEKNPQLRMFLTSIAVTEPLSIEVLESLHLSDRDMFIDEKPNAYCYYGKLTGDNRLLVRYGDTEVDTSRSAHDVNMRDIAAIEIYLSKIFPALTVNITHVWSASYAVTSGTVPMVHVEDAIAHVNGAGLQIGSMVAAEAAVHALLGKPHPLEGLWAKAPLVAVPESSIVTV